MNARKFLSLLMLIVIVFCAACSAATPPAPIAVEPQNSTAPRQTIPQAEEPRPLATQAAGDHAPAQGPAVPEAEEPFWQPPAPDNQFQDYGVNPETHTGYDHLSTFALDVDTASYSVARRYINEGSLPPYDAVRVEEFVNAFDQGYASPRDAAFSVYADGAPAPGGF